MCRFFETIRITDGRPQFLSWHESRLNRTRNKFWPGLSPILLEKIIDPPAGLSKGVARCKVIYGREIESIMFSSYTRKTIKSLMVVTGDEMKYEHKYFDRAGLEGLMAMRSDCDDIIIVKNGFVTDSSMANLIFFDGGKWVTPEDPLLQGTCRARLLGEGLIKEGKIRPEGLDRFLGVKLINAMRYPEESELIPVSGIQKMATFAKKKR